MLGPVARRRKCRKASIALVRSVSSIAGPLSRRKRRRAREKAGACRKGSWMIGPAAGGRTVPTSALPPRRGGFGSAQACLRFQGAVACRRAREKSGGLPQGADLASAPFAKFQPVKIRPPLGLPQRSHDWRLRGRDFFSASAAGSVARLRQTSRRRRGGGTCVLAANPSPDRGRPGPGRSMGVLAVAEARCVRRKGSCIARHHCGAVARGCGT